jgi:hypothetical protein
MALGSCSWRLDGARVVKLALALRARGSASNLSARTSTCGARQCRRTDSQFSLPRAAQQGPRLDRRKRQVRCHNTPQPHSARQHRSPFPQETSAKKAAPTANSAESLHPSGDLLPTTSWTRRWHMAARRGRVLRADQRGAATAELVLAVPLLMLLILLVAQFALYMHAAHVAQAAAAQALSVTRVEGGTAADGQNAADQMLAQLASGPLRHPSVSVSRDAVAARVQIQGEVTAVIPFLHLTASGTADGPVERFVPATSAGSGP